MSAEPRVPPPSSQGPQGLPDAHRQLETELGERKRAGAEQERMMRALVIAQELELERISRELHDGVGQNVTALLLGLKHLEEMLDGDADARAEFHSLQEIAKRIGRDVHSVAVELRPTSLSDLGVVHSLANFIADRAARSKTTVDFDHEEFGRERLAELVETTLYRVVCEALNNVFRHAHATHASVILRRTGNRVIGIVEDNGAGFDVTAVENTRPRARLGLVGMRERVALVEGEIAIESAPGKGTTVIVRLPLSSASNSPFHA